MGMKTSTTATGWRAYSTSVTDFDIFSQAACTDPQDKIYGISSFLKELENFDVDDGVYQQNDQKYNQDHNTIPIADPFMTRNN
jgi:hypothetical protein